MRVGGQTLAKVETLINSHPRLIGLLGLSGETQDTYILQFTSCIASQIGSTCEPNESKYS